MPTLLNPNFAVAFDPATDRIVITLRDGRDGQVVELDPEMAPALINALMAARNVAKEAAKRKVPPPPPPPPPPPRKPFVRHPDWTRTGHGARR